MKFIKSPLNYTGGKHKLLSNLISAFPENIDTFVDLFAGGFNVGINIEANKIVCNDHITYLIELYKTLADKSIDETLGFVQERITQYELSQINVDGYNALRDYYNENKNVMDLFVLTCYAFNHQIRFNNKHKFNTPFGKERSSYNKNIEKNLINFCNALKDKNVIFENKDFLKVDLGELSSSSLVYCDPPYLISTGSYNDGKRGFKDWTEKEESELLTLLDELNERNIKFALSNVLYHKGMTNDLLVEWSKKYCTMFIDKIYSNCSYQFKDRDAKTVEVLITNYNYLKEGSSVCEQIKLL